MSSDTQGLKSRRRRVFRGCAAVAVLGLGLVVAEVVLRVRERTEAPPKRDSWHVFDPIRGWKNKPGYQGEGPVPGTDLVFPVRINAQGLRHDRAVAAIASPGVTRICAVGDSFTFGFGVPIEQGYVTQLQTTLGPTAEVLNLGTCAVGVGQIRLALELQALPLAPDVLLLTVIRQNFRRAVRTVAYGAQLKPRFVLDGDGVRLANTPLPTPREGGVPFSDMPPEGGSFLLWKLGLLAEKASATLSGVDPRWRLSHAILRDAQRVADGAKVPLVVVLFPTPKGLVGEDPFRAPLIAQTDVTVLDLYPAFTDAKATAASHYLPDGHPNAKGHALAASAIAAYLKANGLTPK